MMTQNHNKKEHSENSKVEEKKNHVVDAGVKETAKSESLRSDKVEVAASEYEALKQKVAELEGLREKLFHSAADYENAKKRNDREKEEFIKYSQERILRGILPVLDNFERAIKHATLAAEKNPDETVLKQNFKAFIDGVAQVEKQLLDILKQHGLNKLETAGKSFDPHFHEAVMQVAEDGKEDHIVDELEPGYMLHDRLLRAAKVRVRVAPTK